MYSSEHYELSDMRVFWNSCSTLVNVEIRYANLELLLESIPIVCIEQHLESVPRYQCESLYLQNN